MSMDDVVSGMRLWRTNFRRLTGRSEDTIRDKLGLLKENFTTKLQSGIQAQQCNSTSGAAGCPTAPQTAPNTGAQAQIYTDTSRKAGLIGLGILNLRPPQQQQAPPPPPPTAEQMKQIAEQEQIRVLEDKQKRAKKRKYRMDTLQGLSVGN